MMRGILKFFYIFTIIVFLSGMSYLISGCGKEKVIIRYREIPPPVELISPANDTLIHENNPTFVWRGIADAGRYQLQVATSSNFINKSVNVEISDTAYTTINPLINTSFYWRVRARNQDDVWGDWSDADIWTFYKTDNIFYIPFMGSVITVGSARDVVVRNDTAYVADGAADLTIVDALDKENPSIIQNIDTIDDDYAMAVYINPQDTVPYAFVADLDGSVQVINTYDASPINNGSFGTQNIEDLSGVFIQDTLYIFTVRSASGFNLAGMALYQIIYEPNFPPHPGPWVWNPIDLPADAKGVYADTAYSYVACDVVGLIIIDHTDIYNPFQISSLDLEGSSLSVHAQGDYVYVAADRAGIYVVDATDKAAPTIASQVNTSGRTNDVHVVGDYAFIADGSGGLKVIDVSVPDSSHFIAAYDTPYAYGVYADSNYIYICDRDEGLMVFENLVVE
ncbi:MAG: hypothetical protein JSW64_14980 [Candidatus Zixiibacteriota bacterium]|nr:MAG: hypothetical protein JSW64_14980 [candidate division Zixibacteria bacterium]